MLGNLSTRAVLRASVSCAFMCAASPIFAQGADETDLGVLILGDSKRDIETETAIPTTTIDETEIRDRQAGTVGQLIDTVPGVSLINGATPTGSGINIRGFGGNSTFGTDQKVLIQIDGATKGGEELYRIGTQLFTDPFLFKNVEVLRGTIGSFEYGSGVFGGVVLLETIDASDLTLGEPGFAGRQTFEFSSNGEGISSSTTLAYQAGDTAEFLLNYSRRTLDVRKDGNGNDIAPDSGDIDNPSWLAKAKFYFGEDREHSLTFSYTDTEDDRRDVPYETFGSFDFGNVDRVIQNKTASLRYNWNPIDSDLIDLDIDLTYSDEFIESTAVGPSPVAVNLRNADHKFETTTLRIKNTSLFTLGSTNHKLRAGVEVVSRKRKDANSAPGGTKESFAVFAVDEISFNNGLTLTPALRYETQTIHSDPFVAPGDFSKDAFMGGLAAHYDFGNGWSVFGSYARTENLPIMDDLLNATLIDQSEKGEIYEIGFAYDRGDVFTDGDDFAFKLNYYTQSIDDVTTYRSFPTSASTQSVDREGIELEASYAMQNGLYADFNAHFSSGSAVTLAGDKIDFRQNPADNLLLTLGKKFGEEWDVSWEINAVADYKVGAADDDGYAVHNLRATYAPQQGVLKGTEVRFGVENVFDKFYQPRLATRPATGRNFVLTVSTTF
ncbi:MAG: TonB-dependent receptor [Pseudomonadota bacterium]